MDQGYFYSGRDGEKGGEKDILTLLFLSLSLTGESNMNMNATCVAINVGK